MASLSEQDRTLRYHQPVADWCRARLSEQKERPGVIGLNGPQGAGKSTLAAALVTRLAHSGLRGIALSIDDFYLTHVEQRALAAKAAGNPYLEHRGYPGTHDIALGGAVLRSLIAGRDTRIPSYDKSAHGGRGDRAPESGWRTVSGRLDFILFEGWMLGFAPAQEASEEASEEASVEPFLRAPNQMLSAYSEWSDLLDFMIILNASSLSHIVHWRIDSERARRDRGKTALSDEDARDYIERFLPAYRLWTPELHAHPPGRAQLTIELGEDRMPLLIVEGV